MASQKTRKEGNVLSEKVQNEADRHEPPETLPHGDKSATRTDDFPAKYLSRTETQRKVTLARNYTNALSKKINGSGPMVVYTPSAEEINILVDKENELNLASFERFIRDRFNLNDPVQSRLVHEMYPEYFEKRLEQIDSHLELQRRAAKIKLLGIQDKDDLMFLYAIASNKIKIPDNAVFAPKSYNDTESFERGLLNPRRITLHPELPENSNLWGNVAYANFGAESDFTNVGKDVNALLKPTVEKVGGESLFNQIFGGEGSYQELRGEKGKEEAFGKGMM